MKITRQQLKRVIREAMSDVEKAQAAAIASNKKHAARPPATRKPPPFKQNPEVLELGNQLTAAMESGDKAEEARLMQALRDHSPEGADEVEERAEAFHFSGPMRITGGGIHESRKVTKRQLKRIIREEKRQILKEYGGSHGKVSWYEDDVHEVVFDVEGYGERLTQDAVWDIANDAGDEEITADIQAAVQDWEDYMYSS